MADYVAKQGTTALGIIGTALGGLATAGGLLNMGSGSYPVATQKDLEQSQIISEQAATIALLRSNADTDAKLKDVYVAAAERDNNFRKELNEELKEVRKEMRIEHVKQTEVNAAQAVINANTNSTLAVLGSQQAQSAALLADITKTAVPTSAICNFGGGCSSCSSNI